ncbi:MAG: hydantoinase/oxoprolinase family protein [Gammaproteobacteria bacterium]|nr:hydantoinase/oxoprolinase family protein [Gammaproteobacteria bacterium]
MPDQNPRLPLILGVDTGGTFTDFVLLRGGQITIYKALSTPGAPECAILKGIDELGIAVDDYPSLTLIHGSTVATNAALEGKGVRTVYITNQGMGDLLTIGRQARRELYNLQPEPTPPPVPRNYCIETGGRIDAQGETIDPLTEGDLIQIRETIESLQPEAVAINLLFSFIDSRFEEAIEKVIPSNIFCSRSSKILPEYREYERGITTWLNNWVGPLVKSYIKRLTASLPAAQISVMQSSGTTIAASQAGDEAVRMLLSGPAGGLAGAKGVAGMAGCEHLLTFDMGGTSTDVAMIDGELELTTEGRIGPWPVAVPMVDMHTIGAGGGSIAYLDTGGMLHVGPESAGANPGPACYGLGGSQPTVTDANLVLGRIVADAFLGGAMSLDPDAARVAIETLAEPMNLSIEAAAEGIILLANEQMARALRVISIEQGADPRFATLISFGGAGGLHVCALADAMGMKKAMVPIHSGVLSALGMLMAPRGRQLSHALHGLLSEMSIEVIKEKFTLLGTEGGEELLQEGLAANELSTTTHLDLRYRGQSYTLAILWEPDRGIKHHIDQFHKAHLQRYGHELDLPVELVTLRLKLTGPDPEITLLPQENSKRKFEHPNGQLKSYERLTLTPQQSLKGPALIIDPVSTTYLAPEWQATIDDVGNLLLKRC